jgi:hypothetical protein
LKPSADYAGLRSEIARVGGLVGTKGAAGILGRSEGLVRQLASEDPKLRDPDFPLPLFLPDTKRRVWFAGEILDYKARHSSRFGRT